jgi:hypothetical protein
MLILLMDDRNLVMSTSSLMKASLALCFDTVLKVQAPMKSFALSLDVG